MAAKKAKPATKRKKTKKTAAKTAAPKKPVPFNELYPDASRIPYVKNFLAKRSK